MSNLVYITPNPPTTPVLVFQLVGEGGGHRQLFCPDWSSSVWRTDVDVG